MQKWCVLALALCACGKGKDVDPCRAAGEQYANVRHAAKSDESDKQIKAAGRAVEVACRSDVWDASAIACVRKAASLDGANACFEKLSADDREQLTGRLDPAERAAPPDADVGSAGSATQAEGDCEGAVDHMAMLQQNVMMAAPKKDQAHLQDRITKMREAMLHACHETKWSAEMTTCMKNMKSLDDGDECEKLETPEQSDFAEKALEATQKAGSAQ